MSLDSTIRISRSSRHGGVKQYKTHTRAATLTNYLINIGSHALIMVSVPDQSNELSVLDGDDDDESVSPD